MIIIVCFSGITFASHDRIEGKSISASDSVTRQPEQKDVFQKTEGKSRFNSTDINVPTVKTITIITTEETI